MKKKLMPLRTGRPVRPRKNIDTDKLKSLRVDADLSCAALAEQAAQKCGLDIRAGLIMSAEAGTTKMSDPVLEAVCKVLGIRVDDIVAEEQR